MYRSLKYHVGAEQAGGTVELPEVKVLRTFQWLLEDKERTTVDGWIEDLVVKYRQKSCLQPLEDGDAGETAKDGALVPLSGNGLVAGGASASASSSSSEQKKQDKQDAAAAARREAMFQKLFKGKAASA